jgi:hypothetical protein
VATPRRTHADVIIQVGKGSVRHGNPVDALLRGVAFPPCER